MKQLTAILSLAALTFLTAFSAQADFSEIKEIFYNSPQNFGLPVMKIIPHAQTNEVEVVIGGALYEYGNAVHNPDFYKKMEEHFGLEHMGGLSFTFPAKGCRGKTLMTADSPLLINCSTLGGSGVVKVRGANLSWDGKSVEYSEVEEVAESVSIRVDNIQEQSVTQLRQYLRAKIYSSFRIGPDPKDRVVISGAKEQIRVSPIVNPILN